MSLERIKLPISRSYPPRVSAFSLPFWTALNEGKWITSCCADCGRQTFPPKSVCPHCWSSNVIWSDLSDRGTLYSWTRIHSAPTAFADEAPYAVCIVDLDSGIRLACRLVERDDVTVAPGIPVEIVVLAYEDGPLFAARPMDTVSD